MPPKPEISEESKDGVLTAEIQRSWASIYRGYFLNKASKASLALVIFFAEDVSRSIAFFGVRRGHWFRTLFLGIRSEMGCTHSNRALVSNQAHCLQVCKSALHFGHWLSSSISALMEAPHMEQR